MKKEVILILIVLLFATAAYAVCDITDTINKTSPKNYTVKGKDYSVTLYSLTNSSGDWIAKFKVNGVMTPELEETQQHTFNDLSKIKILSVISLSSAQICFNAGLLGYGKGTCSSIQECDDNNSCTIDECDGDPLRCRRKLILWCRNDDGCCPESRCTEESDNDCGKAILTECINDSDCDDNNATTIDVCDNTTKKCNNTKITECISGDNYCPGNCSFTLDMDCNECSADEDCKDNNACTTDTCLGAPKKCSNTVTSGCNFNGECISIGTKTEDQFCDTDDAIKPLRPKKEYCDNDYECLSNKCKKNKCKGIFFIKKITKWFKGLFGD